MPADKTTKYNKITAYCLGFICFILFVYILMALREILIPVTIAVFLTYLFHPLMIYLKRFRIPKWLSLLLILLAVSGFYYLLGIILISSFSTIPDKLQVYSENFSNTVKGILSSFNITVQEFLKFLNITPKEFEINSIFRRLFKEGVIQNIFDSVSGILGDFFISLIFWVFMMMGKRKFEERLRVAFAEKSDVVDKNIESIDNQIQSYIVIKTVLSLIVGVTSTIILLAYNIDFAIVWGILTFFLNYIPNIGSFISTAAPVLIALLEYGFGFRTISLTALLLINHNIIGNLVEPHYLGRRMDLSPVFVLFSLIFWGWVWGIMGMFFAVPIAASMKILFSNINALKPFAVLMGSKAVPANGVTE